MPISFLDKVTGILDQRFTVAFWTPAFIGLALMSGLTGILLGPTAVFSWFAKLSGTEQVLLGGGILLTSIFLAYLLEALADPIVCLYEGVWSEGKLKRWMCVLQQKHFDHQKVVDKRKTPTNQQRAEQERYTYFVRYYHFPRDSDLIKPTRLGNVLAASEEYAYQIYGLDTYLWWPRLTTLLPETFRVRVDASFTPMIALLNLNIIMTLLAIVGGVTLLLMGIPWVWFLAVLIGGLLLARACYIAAVSQAVDYGKLMRVAFDLYRHEVLKQMHMHVPDNVVDERRLWTVLNLWVYQYIAPWEAELVVNAPKPPNPFYYDTHDTSSTPTHQQDITLTVKGLPSLELKYTEDFHQLNKVDKNI